MCNRIAARHSAPWRLGARGGWVVLGATLLLVAGCGGSTSSSEPSPAGTAAGSTSQPSAQPTTSRNFQVSTPDGQVSVSLDGRLPPNWPGTFPIPSGATPAGSGSLGGSSSTGMVGVFRTPEPPADTFTYYTSSSTVTTTNPRTVGAGSTYVGSTRVTAPYPGSVTVAGRSDTTFIVIVLNMPAASPSG